jgi:hypothetical protein
MNITFENKLFHGKIEDSLTESLIPVDKNLFNNPSALSGKITELRQRSDQLQDLIYRKAVSLERQIIDWNLTYPKMLVQLEEYEKHINDQLFLRSDSDGFFRVIGDNFTTSSKFDQALSSQVVLDEALHSVSLEHSTEPAKLTLPAGAYSINMYMAPGSGNDRIVPVYGSNLTNLFASSMSSWTGQVVTDEPKKVSIILEIVFPETREVGELAISVIDSSLSGSIDAISIDSENVATPIVQAQAITNTNTVLVNRAVKKINIQITKSNYDEKYDSGKYRYIFHIKRLAIKVSTDGYKTEGKFRSVGESVQASKFAIEVCDFEDDETAIHYYIVSKNLPGLVDSAVANVVGGSIGLNARLAFDYSSLSISDPGDEAGYYSDVLSYFTVNEAGTNYEVNDLLMFRGDELGSQSPDNDLYIRVLDVDGSGGLVDFEIVSGTYSLGQVAEITPLNKPPGSAPYFFSLNENNITNNYITPNTLESSKGSSEILTSLGSYGFLQEYNYHYVNQILSPTINSLDSINLFGNYVSKNSAEDLLESKDGYYITWVYVDGTINSEINVGDSGVIFEGLNPTNRTYKFTKNGWFKVKIPITSYTDVGEDFFTDNESLKNLDTKYPYNGKYLIEGTNLNLDPYRGFKIRAKKKFTRCHSLANLGKENFYLMAVDPTQYILVLHNQVDIKDAYVEFPRQTGFATQNKEVSLIAKLKTTNTSKTPILGSYKIKLGE